MTIHVMGHDQVVTLAFARDYSPAIALLNRDQLWDDAVKPTAEQLLSNPQTTIVHFTTPDSALKHLDLVMDAVIAAGKAQGVADLDELRLPIVHLADHEKALAELKVEHGRRVTELLVSNNALLERARQAEAQVNKLEDEAELLEVLARS